MKFLTVFNFATTFNENVTIIGFEVYPVRERKEKRVVVETVRCEPHEAHGWALNAVTADESYEWIADFKTKEDADSFALLLQAIYRSAANNRPAEPDSQYEAFGFGIEDVMNTANEDLVWVATNEDAIAILKIVEDRADMSIGVSWQNISLALDEWLSDTDREKFPTYTEEQLEAIEKHEHNDYFRILPMTEAKVDGKCYALDLRDGSEFLLDNDHDLQRLKDSGDFAFGTEL